jgi:ABC-type phosphate transport system substrate-binding protein
MTKLKTRILMSACVALAGSAMLSSEALAAGKPTAATTIYGAGSSLVAPYWNQTGNCYGAPVALLEENSVSPPSPPTSVTTPAFNFVDSGKPADSQNCATTHANTNYTVDYISTGSGIGVAGVYSHNAQEYGQVNQGDTPAYWPSVQYGLSDYGIVQSDVNTYNQGGTEGSGSSAVTVVAPGVTPGAGQYGNPLQLYGPLIVFPFSVDPVAISYNTTYEKVYNPSTQAVTSYHFNVRSSYLRSDDSGGLRLSPATYCKIFTGEITNWNDPAIKADNGGQALEDASDPTPHKKWSVPIQIVGRSDSSGTTSIWYRHLATVCTSLITAGSNPYAAAGSHTLPASLSGPAYTSSNPNYPSVSGETVGEYTRANLNSGVAQYIAFTAVPNGENGNVDSSGAANVNAITLGRIGYLGPDYALPYANSTGADNYGLQTATLKNSSSQWEAPSPATALKAFSVLTPPTGSNAADPANWVVGVAAGSSIANPTTSGAYPIVGTTNFFGYQCYSTANKAHEVVNLLNYIENKPINTSQTGILASAGLAPLPKTWATAILDNFVNNTSDNGLTIAPVGTAGACSVSGVIGG